MTIMTIRRLCNFNRLICHCSYCRGQEDTNVRVFTQISMFLAKSCLSWICFYVWNIVEMFYLRGIFIACTSLNISTGGPINEARRNICSRDSYRLTICFQHYSVGKRLGVEPDSHKTAKRFWNLSCLNDVD